MRMSEPFEVLADEQIRQAPAAPLSRREALAREREAAKHGSRRRQQQAQTAASLAPAPAVPGVAATAAARVTAAPTQPAEPAVPAHATVSPPPAVPTAPVTAEGSAPGAPSAPVAPRRSARPRPSGRANDVRAPKTRASKTTAAGNATKRREHPVPIRRAVVRGVVSLSFVAGLFATFVIPAYSLTDQGNFASSSTFISTKESAQTVAVTGTANTQLASTDQYSSESASQIAAAQFVAARSASGYVPTVRAPGDDYPYWNMPTEYSGGGLSPFGYYYRECVDFVAWRINRDAGSTSAPYRWVWNNLASGSAYMWYSAWVSHGWPTSSTPVAGAVAWFPYNHVAYVNSVNSDGSVNIEEYNWGGDHAYHARTIQATEAVYLYPPS